MKNGFGKFLIATLVLIVLMIAPVAAQSANPSPQLPEISTYVSFDIKGGVMKGLSTIAFPEAREWVINVGLLTIRSLKLNGNAVEFRVRGGKFSVKAAKGDLFEIEYLCSSGKDSACRINEKGILLTGPWHPTVEGLFFHKLRALVPKDFTALSEAEDVEVEHKPEGDLFSFSFPHPVEGTNLIAGAFSVRKELFEGIELSTYFFPEDAALAEAYLEDTKKYIRLYEGMIGRFPFKRFSVAENFLPTGYSMPTFTLIGQDVVRLPFIVKTSLGHEILHQWFGNLLYVDYERGNWAEGLTTYLSDHLYEEQEGRGWEYRKQILAGYESYTVQEKESALRDFRNGVDFSSRAVGYGKAAMVFHMLRRIVGEDQFFGGLRALVEDRRFRKTSWEDILAVFEKGPAGKLDWFFNQWVNEKGMPSFEIGNVSIHPKGLQYAIFFDVIQKDRAFVIGLPVAVRTDAGEVRQTLEVKDKKQTFEIIVDGRPGELVIDGNYDTFRRLSEEETPPAIADVLGEEKGLLVLSDGTGSLFSEAEEFFKRRNYTSKKPGEIENEELKKISVVVLGSENPVLKRLYGLTEKPPQGLSFTVKRNPLNPSKVVAVLDAGSEQEVRAALGKITHYGKYSSVLFKEGKNVDKQIAKSQRGWTVPLKETVTGVEVQKALTLDDIVRKVSGKKIIYVGEEHDRYEQHVMQLDIIRGLFKEDPRLAIGMEMFQRPSQKALDEYIEGRIDEHEFLKASGYFKQWGFDYNYYRDILRFARDEKIPVIALNIRREIVNKVGRGGIDSLSADEKKELPEFMDMSDEEYGKRLREIFEKHEGSHGREFGNFYQSQVIWDEVMAETIDGFLRKHPDHRFVVIAGGGHFVFGSGIPKRTFRRNGLDYVVVLNDVAVEPGIADFILFPKNMTATRSPKLMVMLKEEEGRVRIAGFPESSVSEKAGLKADDVIVSLDDTKVGSVEDMQIFLFYKKEGDTVKVRILRKRFLLGEREMELDVTL